MLKLKTRYKILATCFNKYGIPLSKGENSYKKTHPLQAYFAEKVGHPQRIYLHAEILALIRAGDKKIDRILIERRDKYGNNYPSKPCPICFEAIRAYGVKYLYYMDENHMFVTEKL